MSACAARVSACAARACGVGVSRAARHAKKLGGAPSRHALVQQALHPPNHACACVQVPIFPSTLSTLSCPEKNTAKRHKGTKTGIKSAAPLSMPSISPPSVLSHFPRSASSHRCLVIVMFGAGFPPLFPGDPRRGCRVLGGRRRRDGARGRGHGEQGARRTRTLIPRTCGLTCWSAP